MNEKIKWVLISFGVCIIFFFIGFICATNISNGKFNKQIESLSDTIKTGEDVNRELRKANIELATRNKFVEGRITDLNEQLADNNRRYQESLNGIKFSLATISRELGSSKDIIQGVIEGLEQIKILIRSLAVL